MKQQQAFATGGEAIIYMQHCEVGQR
jgi:hypothetical protein